MALLFTSVWNERLPTCPPCDIIHRQLAHFSVEIRDDRPMGKDYAGDNREKHRTYGDLLIADMKDEPYTPTEAVDSTPDDSQGPPFEKATYTDDHSHDACEVQLENGRSIYLQEVEQHRMEGYVINIIRQLNHIQGNVMVGDIISSYLDTISDQLQNQEEMECQVAIIYHVIDINTCPGGRIITTTNTTEHDRPEQKHVRLADS